MKHKNWKIAGSILLCTAVSVSVWVSCVLVRAEGESDLEEESLEKEFSESLVDVRENLSGGVGELSAMEESLVRASYGWDFLDKEAYFEGDYEFPVVFETDDGWVLRTTGDIKYLHVFDYLLDRCRYKNFSLLHSVVVTVRKAEAYYDPWDYPSLLASHILPVTKCMTETETLVWENLLETWGLPVCVCEPSSYSGFEMQTTQVKYLKERVSRGSYYAMTLSMADMCRLADLAAKNGYSVRFSVRSE